MKNELSCEVVRDLLPGYVDQMTSDVTNKAVETHLAGCAACAAALERMRSPEGQTAKEAEQEKKAIDYLEKYRTSRRREIGRAILRFAVGAAALIIILWLAAIYFYPRNTTIAELKYYQVDVAGAEDDTVNFSALLRDNSQGISDIRFEEEDGTVNVVIRRTHRSFFHAQSADASYHAQGPVQLIALYDGGKYEPIWGDGEKLDKLTTDLFSIRNLYVGSVSNDLYFAEVLGLGDHFGSYTNELETAQRPYVWRLLFDELETEDEAQLQEELRPYACVLLAGIDNLDTVEFCYTVNGERRTMTVTEKDADAAVGESVKGLASTPTGMQRLLRLTGLIR